MGMPLVSCEWGGGNEEELQKEWGGEIITGVEGTRGDEQQLMWVKSSFIDWIYSLSQCL